MATPSPTITALTTHGEGGVHIASWAMAGADTGVAIEMSGSADRSVQITGTYDSATIVIEGSNDGTNYTTLTDPQGNALSRTTGNIIEQIEELTRYIRPKTTGGGGSCALVVTMLLRRVRR